MRTAEFVVGRKVIFITAVIYYWLFEGYNKGN